MAKPRTQKNIILKGTPSEDGKMITFPRKTFDGFMNMMASLGFNTSNQFAEGYYSLGPFLSRMRVQLEAMYRSNWIAGQIVDTIAEDMTRAGAEMVSESSPEDVQKMDKAIGELAIWKKVSDCIRWARLFGGCLGYLIIDGQDPKTPLRIETIGKGQFKGIFPFDRWLLWPSLSELITDFGVDLGMPKYYTVIGDAAALPGIKIHHSRCLRFDGIPLPYYQAKFENMWGESVIERLHDRLVAFDSVTQGAAQLVFKAHLRGVGVKGLRAALSEGAAAEQAVIKQFEYVRQMQTNEGLTLLDADDQMWVHQYTFSGLADMILQFGQQISGATGIPLVRLFGQSPTGMNSTGESDLRTYYDNVNKLQENQLRPAFAQKLYPILSMSVLGKPLPEDFDFDFNSLWLLPDKERVDLAKNLGEAVSNLKNSGIFSQKQCLMELRQSSRVTGVFSNITDEDIARADDEVQDFSDLAAFGGKGQEYGNEGDKEQAKEEGKGGPEPDNG